MKYSRITPRKWIYDIESGLYICPYCDTPVAAPDDDPVLLPDYCPVCCFPLTDFTSPVSLFHRTSGAG